MTKDILKKEALAELARVMQERANERGGSFKTLGEQLRKFKKDQEAPAKKRGHKFTKNKKSKRNGKTSSRKEKK